MANLTDGAEGRVLRFLLGQVGATAPTLPLKVRITTTAPADSAAGAAAPGVADVALSTAGEAGGASANDAVLRFEGIAAGTAVVGVEIWDSAGVPFRWWHGALAGGPVTVADGVLEFPAGDLHLAIG